MKMKKNMKRVASLLLALIMVFAMTVTGFADEDSNDAAREKGSIVISGVSESVTYEIYKLLNLKSYDKEKGTYAYEIEGDWAGFFEQEQIKSFIGETEGVLTWKAGDSAEHTEEFAKLALAYAEENSINPVKSSKNNEDFSISESEEPESSTKIGTFSGLDLGYYLVDSTMGALCGLTTTNPVGYITAKNIEPKIEKQVKEDSTSQWGESNTADIGQTVEYRATIYVHDGAQNYVMHDKMSEGLTFLQVSKIEHVSEDETNKTTQTVPVPEDYYTIATGSNVSEYKESDSEAEKEKYCTFEIKFTQEFCNHLETNDKIIVHYEAMLNRNAIVAGAGNPNEVWLEYGEGHRTVSDEVITKTFGIDIIKTDDQNILIDGAEFKIYNDSTASDSNAEVAVVLMDDGVTYRRARADETGVSIVAKDGKVRIVGFDNGIYYLEETKIPDGYNGLSSRQRFIIADNNLDAIFTDGNYNVGSGIHVVNRSGSMLPETGGIGTTIFYIVGGILVFGAVVLMITKKRMGSNE